MLTWFEQTKLNFVKRAWVGGFDVALFISLFRYEDGSTGIPVFLQNVKSVKKEVR